MAEGFVVNADRFDPYKNFKFRILIDGTAVAGVSKVSALKRTTEVVTHRHGGDDSHARVSPGQTKYEAITLERGLTHDPEFAAWASKVHDLNGDPLTDLNGFRKNIILEFMGESSLVVMRYNIYRCWVSEYQALPELDASANAIAIETLKIEHEGWEKDEATKEPAA